jgi:hypothetical protein
MAYEIYSLAITYSFFCLSRAEYPQEHMRIKQIDLNEGFIVLANVMDGFHPDASLNWGFRLSFICI